MVLLSGGDNVVFLVEFCSGSTLGSSQPELEKTLVSEVNADTFFDSSGPRRKSSYLVIIPVPGKKENQISI